MTMHFLCSHASTSTNSTEHLWHVVEQEISITTVQLTNLPQQCVGIGHYGSKPLNVASSLLNL